jgi:hypothetical protein
MIDQAYEKIIEPFSIRSHFKSEDEFISWLESGSLQDLKCTLQAFENAELYEDCIIIQNVIKDLSLAK